MQYKCYYKQKIYQRWWVLYHQMLHLVWSILPSFIQKIVQQHWDEVLNKRRLENYMSNRVLEYDVKNAFAQLSIKGDVKIHSSLVEIGNIQGKHKYIVQCLKEKVLDCGNTILAIAIPVKGSTLNYLRSIKLFNNEAPIAMGVLSTYYASLPGAKRSLEPTHSVVAYGPKATYYTSEHHLDETPFGIHSPYYKLLVQNGSVLMIGADIKHLTLCHLVEDLLGDDFPFPVYDKHSYPVDIIQNDNCIWHGNYKAHSKWSGIMRVPNYVQDKILHLPSTQIVPIGGSQLILINVRDAILCELKELKQGNSIYGYRKISNRCSEAIDNLILQIEDIDNIEKIIKYGN